MGVTRGKGPRASLHSGLHCRRQGRQEVAVTVELEAEGEKEHHELARPLADLLGMKHESRANILQALFTCIRLQELQVGHPLTAHCCAELLPIHWRTRGCQDEDASRPPSHLKAS